MTGIRPGGRQPSKGLPPTSRRSARQQRLANRQARALERAGTRGGSANRAMPLIVGTVIALAIGVVAIGFAYLRTSEPPSAPSGSPIAPYVVTPSDIPRDGTTLGKADAPVVMELWSDFRCTACFGFAMETEPKLIADYIRPGMMKLVYKDFLTIDPLQTRYYGRPINESRDAAAAALCANDQGMFWPMHDWLYANQDPQEGLGAFTQDRLIEIGRLAGLDMSKYEPCVKNGTHRDQIESEQGALPTDATGSPAIYVNGKQVLGDSAPSGGYYIPTYDQIKAAIDAALNASASGSPSASASPSPSASASPSPTASPS
jgi:protein-disulfide isomerase